jgi:transposase
MAYNIKYRERAIEYKQSGHTFAQLYEAFKINSATYYGWLKNKEETGTLKYRTSPGRPPKIDMDILKQAVEERPDAYLRELSELFDCSVVAVHKALKKLGITYKKRHIRIPRNQSPNARNF